MSSGRICLRHGWRGGGPSRCAAGGSGCMARPSAKATEMQAGGGGGGGGRSGSVGWWEGSSAGTRSSPGRRVCVCVCVCACVRVCCTAITARRTPSWPLIRVRRGPAPGRALSESRGLGGGVCVRFTVIKRRDGGSDGGWAGEKGARGSGGGLVLREGGGGGSRWARRWRGAQVRAAFGSVSCRACATRARGRARQMQSRTLEHRVSHARQMRIITCVLACAWAYVRTQ